jgi:cytochrome c oxidase subunit 2
MLIYGGIATAILLPLSLSVDWFPSQGSTSADDIDTLYDWLLIVSVPVFVLVMTVAIYSVIRFRARPGDMGDGEPIHGSARLEVVWVVIPFIMVSALAAYAWITLNDIEEKKRNELVVEVTGQQFAWSYRYKAPNGKPVQASQLYLPVNRPVKFEVQTKDVLHSFWIPSFRLKTDAVPGITTDWRATPTKTGVYDVVCTELCGAGHALMRGNAHVVSQAAFTAWMNKQAGVTAAGPGGGAGTAQGGAGGGAAEDGKAVFASNGCGGCHKLTAAGSSGTTGPNLDNVLADAKKLGKGKPPAEYIRESILQPNAVVVPGFPEGTMPATYEQQLSEEQIKALVEFLSKSGGQGEGGKAE